MKHFLTHTACLLVGLAPLSARAQATPAVPLAQARAFALGYTLRACDLRGIAFIGSVKSLKDIDDAQTPGEVARLGREATALRHTQAVSYEQINSLLTKMGAPAPLRVWASKAATGLAGSPVYGAEEQAQAKSDPNTAAVMAALDEASALKMESDAELPLLAAWLGTGGGPLSVWTAEVGTYTADLRAAATTPGQAVPPLRAARRLLQTAPLGAPSLTRAYLAAMAPRGGNLGDLGTVTPQPVAPEKMAGISEGLLAVYVPRQAPGAVK